MPKTKSLQRTTPIGVAVWPRLNTPDTEFNQDGEFKVDLRLDPTEEGVGAFLADLTKYADDAYAEICNEKGKKLKRSDFPWKNETDKDTGEPTGMVLLRTKMRHRVHPKNGDSFEQRPTLFDSKGTLMDVSTIIGGGSKIRVSLDVVPYYTAQIGAGVTCRLKAVQVIELSQYVRGGNASAHGFDAVDGGYSEPEAPSMPTDVAETVPPASTDSDLEDY
jgi:hypothetical protein